MIKEPFLVTTKEIFKTFLSGDMVEFLDGRLIEPSKANELNS
jgi:hypothetical protein